MKKLAGWTSPSQGEAKLLPQQNVVACLLHPSSKVQRLLCDHNTGRNRSIITGFQLFVGSSHAWSCSSRNSRLPLTGSGKTLCMVRSLALEVAGSHLSQITCSWLFTSFYPAWMRRGARFTSRAMAATKQKLLRGYDQFSSRLSVNRYSN